MCGQVFNCTQLKGLSRVDQVSLSRIQCSHQPGLGLWEVVELRIYKAGNAKLGQKPHNIFYNARVLTVIRVQHLRILKIPVKFSLYGKNGTRQNTFRKAMEEVQSVLAE